MLPGVENPRQHRMHAQTCVSSLHSAAAVANLSASLVIFGLLLLLHLRRALCHDHCLATAIARSFFARRFIRSPVHGSARMSRISLHATLRARADDWLHDIDEFHVVSGAPPRSAPGRNAVLRARW